MKACVLHTKGKLPELRELELPVASENEVLIKLHAASLNHRDIWISKGMYAGIRYPVILGSDGAGEIYEGGSCFKKGDPVLINPGINWGSNENCQDKTFKILGMPDNGTFSEYVSVAEENVYSIPEHLNMQEAAALPLAGLTAYRALFSRGNLSKNDKVLITGSGGGVAIFAIQFAVAMGAEVYVTSSSKEKIQAAKALGAVGGKCYTEKGWAEDMKNEFGSFNLAIDGASGSGLADLIEVAAPAARIVIYGKTAGNVNGVEPARIFWKQLSILGSTMGSPKDFDNMLEFVRNFKIKPIIDQSYSLSNFSKAFDRMAKNEQFGKIILQP